MRKESTGVLLAVFTTAVLIGGVYYFAVVRPGAQQDSAETTWISLEPSGAPSAGNPDVSAETPAEHAATILKCHDPEIGEFFTNAATCDDVDPHNRISIAEPLHTTPGQDHYSGQDYTPPEQDAGNSRSD